MKSSLILVCLVLATSVICEIDREERNVVVEAIHRLLVEHFAKKNHRIDFFYYGQRHGLSHQIINELLRRLPEGITVTLMKFTDADFGMDHLNSPTIILCDTIKRFDKLFDNWGLLKEFVSEYGAWFNHLIYAPGLTAENIHATFKDEPTTSEVAFLINNNRWSIGLATHYLFVPPKCHQNQLKTINTFSQETRRWAFGHFYPNKFVTFHRCSIEVFSTTDETNAIGSEIIDTLAQQFNFSQKKISMDEHNFLVLTHSDHVTNYISHQNNFSMWSAFSSAIYDDSLTFAVPPGEPLTDLQRMFAAFDDGTWIAIGITIAASIAVVQIINRMSQNVQNLVYGLGIRTPMLNLIDNILNGGQNMVPGRNFSRYILTLYTIWCLIIRTCYQSKMFENLNSDMRWPQVETIDELRDQNFTLVHQPYERLWNNYMFADLNVSSFFDRKGIIDGTTNWFDIVPEPANKFMYLTFRKEYFRKVKRVLGRKQPSTTLLDENVMSVPFFMVLPSNIPYMRIFKTKINKMIASGIVQKWHDEYFKIERDPRKFVEEVEPQILDLQTLRFGFIAFLIGLGISTFVFLIEVSIKASKDLSETAVAFYIGKAIPLDKLI